MRSLQTTRFQPRLRQNSILLLSLSLLSFYQDLSQAQALDISTPTSKGETPEGIFTDAELSFSVSPSEVLADETASGGKAVVLKGDGDRFSLAVPAGDAFKIWVRRKFGPLALQSNRNGKQVELKRVSDAPSDWTWSDMGTYSRADLGRSIFIERGPTGAAQVNEPQVDAVVFAPATVQILPPFEPDESAPPLPIKAKIAWDKVVGHMAPEMWGVNDYEILDPQKASDRGLQDYLTQVKFPLIRIHEGGFASRWTDSSTRTWNIEKIKAGFAASTGYGNAKVMMNIAGWPGWLQTGDYLPPDKVDEYVALVGQLVKIMRDEVKHPVAYWEVPNEKEAEYEKRGKLDELWSLFNRLSAEIKKQDPTAKVGGPAMSWPNPVWVEGFLKNCAPNADFISWHNYGSGSIYDSNELLLDKPSGFAANGRKMKDWIAQYAPGRNLETFLTEYNVKWTWTPYERRHENNVGAVFMASTIRQVGLSGITGVMHWHVKGNSYGMINDKDELRLPAHLYLWGTHYLTGAVAQTNVEDEKILEILPVTRTDGAQSLLLINKANRSVRVDGVTSLLPPKATKYVWLARLDAKGYSSPHAVSKHVRELILPGYSVTILSSAPTP